MWNDKNRIRRIVRRKQAARKVSPLIEAFEDRTLLSSSGFLQGTVYLDTTNTPQAGATVQLFQNNILAAPAQTTGSDGSYLFTGLTPGDYQVVETPPTGYANDGTQINSPLNPASRKSGVSSSFWEIRCQGNPVSVHHSGDGKSGVSSSFLPEKTNREIRCQFIILGNPVSVHHSCPKRRTDTGFPVNKTVLVPLTMPNRHRRAIRWGARLRFRFSRLAQARFCSPGIPSQI